MADLHTVAATLPEGLAAYRDIFNLISSINPLVGGLAIWGASIFYKKNTTSTEANTVATKATADAIAKATDEIAVAKRAVVTEIIDKHEGYAQKFDETHALIAAELDKVKVVLVKVAKAAEENARISQKLTLSLTVADAVQERVQRLEKATANLALKVESKEKKQ